MTDSIITQLTQPEAWEEFLAYRLLKGRFTWHEFHEADRFVEQEAYLQLAQKIARGEGLGIPKEKLWATIYTDDDEAFDIW